MNSKITAMVAVVCFALLCAGCTYDGDADKKLDGQLVKTKDGRVFLAQYRLGDVYFLTPVDAGKVQTDSEFVRKY